VEVLCLPRAAAGSCGCRKAAELDQARLLTLQLQVELSQPLLQLPSKALGIGPGLKTEDEVVGVAHDDHIVAGLRPSPALDPEVEYVVQVDVGEQRTDAALLRGPTLHPSPFPVLQHTGLKPLLDLPHDALVRDPVLDELPHPFVVDGIEKAANVRIEHPAHLSPADRDHHGIEGLVLPSTRPESI